MIKTEEKGTDVNIVSYLLLDAFRDDGDLAVIVSNDADLAEPMRIVLREFTQHRSCRLSSRTKGVEFSAPQHGDWNDFQINGPVPLGRGRNPPSEVERCDLVMHMH